MEHWNIAFRAIVAEFESDDHFYSLLKNAISQTGFDACTKYLQVCLNTVGAPLALCIRKDIFNLFLTFCGMESNQGYVGPNIRQALRHRLEQRAIRLSYHRKAVRTVGLDRRSKQQTDMRNNRFAQACKIHAIWLDTPYPPRGQWVVEHPNILNLWKRFLTNGKRHDNCMPRPSIHMLNFKQLFAVIGPDKDAIVYDRESGEIVLVVYRRFCPVPEFVEKADSVVTDAVDILKNVRVCLFLEACALYIEYVSVGRYRLDSTDRILGRFAQCTYIRLGTQHTIKTNLKGDNTEP